MSSKYYVFAPWQEFDKDATQHLIKASTPFAAALAFAIREWGLYHVAEKVYEVYDSRGSVVGKYTTPDWVDDSFGATMKDAFLVEVLVERNECKGAAGEPDNAGGAGAPTQQSSAAPTAATPGDYVDGLALTADHLEFAAFKDGSVVLQGVGYFEFYGGLDDESVPVIERGFRERHGLRLLRGNTFDTMYPSGAEAAAALKADGAIHCPELQAFVDA